MKPVARCSVIALGIVVAANLAAPLLHSAAAQAPKPTRPIKELMETEIADASNTLWATSEVPKTEAEWRAVEIAAQTLIDAASMVAVGGTGPRDNEWAKQSAWQAFNGVMLDASQQALTAARMKDYDALVAASDVLYPPCEGCHLQFNPGVTGEPQ